MEEPIYDVEVYDAHKQLQSEAMTTAIEAADWTLENAGSDDVHIDDLTDRYEQEFKLALGEQYYNQYANVAGYAYFTDQQDGPIEDYEFIHISGCTFHQFTVVRIDDTPKLVLEFQLENYKDSTGALRSGLCYIKPSDIRKLEIMSAENIETALHRHGELAKHMTDDPEFLQASREEQMTLLDSVCDHINDETPELTPGMNINVFANRFLVEFGDMPISPHDMITDQTQTDTSERFVIEGKFKRYGFPEAGYSEAPFRQRIDFYIGRGAPCMIVENVATSALFAIPIDDIYSIEHSHNS
jgi:hypothetical protein